MWEHRHRRCLARLQRPECRALHSLNAPFHAPSHRRILDLELVWHAGVLRPFSVPTTVYSMDAMDRERAGVRPGGAAVGGIQRRVHQPIPVYAKHVLEEHLEALTAAVVHRPPNRAVVHLSRPHIQKLQHFTIDAFLMSSQILQRSKLGRRQFHHCWVNAPGFRERGVTVLACLRRLERRADSRLESMRRTLRIRRGKMRWVGVNGQSRGLRTLGEEWKIFWRSEPRTDTSLVPREAGRSGAVPRVLSSVAFPGSSAPM